MQTGEEVWPLTKVPEVGDVLLLSSGDLQLVHGALTHVAVG